MQRRASARWSWCASSARVCRGRSGVRAGRSWTESSAGCSSSALPVPGALPQWQVRECQPTGRCSLRVANADADADAGCVLLHLVGAHRHSLQASSIIEFQFSAECTLRTRTSTIRTVRTDTTSIFVQYLYRTALAKCRVQKTLGRTSVL